MALFESATVALMLLSEILLVAQTEDMLEDHLPVAEIIDVSPTMIQASRGITTTRFPNKTIRSMSLKCDLPPSDVTNLPLGVTTVAEVPTFNLIDNLTEVLIKRTDENLTISQLMTMLIHRTTDHQPQGTHPNLTILATLTTLDDINSHISGMTTVLTIKDSKDNPRGLTIITVDDTMGQINNLGKVIGTTTDFRTGETTDFMDREITPLETISHTE